MRRRVWLLLLLGLMGLSAMAHESRPAYLELNETAAGRYDVLWRTPVLSGMRLPIALRFAEGVRTVVDPVESQLNDSLIERRVIEAGPAGLGGQRIEFVGLQASITDVLVRVSRLDGSLTTTLVHPAQPWMEIAATPGMFSVAGAFLLHGIQHILGGFDHLLFVFGLLLLVGNGWMLVKTITAFTLAHSITLALAALGAVQLPGPPVEATIALSILLLAVEIVRKNRGDVSFTIQWPWVVAFCFGLLHGFGFAGALARSACPSVTCRWRCSRSMSASRSASCCSSPPCCACERCCCVVGCHGPRSCMPDRWRPTGWAHWRPSGFSNESRASGPELHPVTAVFRRRGI